MIFPPDDMVSKNLEDVIKEYLGKGFIECPECESKFDVNDNQCNECGYSNPVVKLDLLSEEG